MLSWSGTIRWYAPGRSLEALYTHMQAPFAVAPVSDQPNIEDVHTDGVRCVTDVVSYRKAV
jgi:hypothetical protein